MDITKYQQALEKRLEQQQEILNTATEDAESIRRPHCRDGGEIAEERERAVIIDNTLQQSQLNINSIDIALEKIKQNKYGKCDLCGDQISSKRLTITPEAAYCRSCQEIADS